MRTARVRLEGSSARVRNVQSNHAGQDGTVRAGNEQRENSRRLTEMLKSMRTPTVPQNDSRGVTEPQTTYTEEPTRKMTGGENSRKIAVPCRDEQHQ